MSFLRYCGYCDADRLPNFQGVCPACGNKVAPTRAPTSPTIIGYDPATSADLSVVHPPLTRTQLRKLAVLGRYQRGLGAWDDAELVGLRTAGLVDGEMLRNVTGNASSTYLWSITASGRAFLSTEGVRL